MQTSFIPSLGGVVARKYRIDREIGRGGMGIVYAATDLTLGRTVALKLLIATDPSGATLPPGSTSPEDTARFMREARATAALRGEHVAQVYEASITPEGVPFLAMELLHGEDLDRYVARRGPLPYVEACDLLIQACAALHEAHQLGIVHRDLKPQNFFVLPPRDATGPKLKVLDFGISKMTSEADLGLTHTTMTMGSPRYMSPEQVRSSKYVDARADLWALGTVLFEALTGRPLFNESTASALHAQIIADHALPLRHVRVDAPADLEQVVLRCVEKDPNRRYGSAVELAHALAPFASPVGRDVASRLLRTHGVTLPSVSPAIGGAVPYPAGTPGYTPTGHPLGGQPVTGSHAVRATARTGSLTWLWIALGIFCALCIIGAAIFAAVIGAVANTVPTEPTSLEEPDGDPASDAPPPSSAPTEPATPTPTPVPPTSPRAPRARGDGGSPAASAAQTAAEARARRKSEQSFLDPVIAEQIRRATKNDATGSCRTNQHVANRTDVPCDGKAVAAAIQACDLANEPHVIMQIQANSQARCAREAQGSF